ncbi:MAG: MinD/ParA family protein [Thermodesulfobacteriota bacterium]
MRNHLPKNVKPRRFCISSGKGGVGKTSLAVNLGLALAEPGNRVLIVDGDLGLANVDVLLRLPVHSTIQDILDRGGDPLETVVYLMPNLGILPASSGVPDMVNLGLEDQAQLASVLTAIGAHFDYVLVDTAAGLGPSVLWFNTLADHIILVVTPDPTSLTDAYAMIKVLFQEYHRRQFHILMNLVKEETEGRQTFNTLAKVAAKFLNLTLDYLGSVPQDYAVIKAVREQVPFLKLSPQSPASQAVENLAARLPELPRERPLNLVPDFQAKVAVDG